MPTLTHADLALNYQLIGPDLSPASPPVSLIHGLGANLAFWYLGALRHLGRDRTILLHDLRGHGASSMPEAGYGLTQMVEDFRLLLDTLGIGRTHVVGHSHGARVALLFALTYPERVESLVLADTQLRALQPPMTLAEWPHWQDWKADLTARGVTTFPPEDAVIDFQLLAELGPRSAGGRGARSVVDAAPAGAKGRIGGAGFGATHRRRGRGQMGSQMGLRDGLQMGGPRRIDLQSRQMGARGAQQWQTLMTTTHAPEEMHDESAIRLADMRRLTMPVLLVYGALSHCVPTADRLAETLPNARRILVPGAGHFFPIVKPRPFARALSVFFAGQSIGQGRATLVRKSRRQPQGAGSVRYLAQTGGSADPPQVRPETDLMNGSANGPVNGPAHGAGTEGDSPTATSTATATQAAAQVTSRPFLSRRLRSGLVARAAQLVRRAR